MNINIKLSKNDKKCCNSDTSVVFWKKGRCRNASDRIFRILQEVFLWEKKSVESENIPMAWHWL